MELPPAAWTHRLLMSVIGSPHIEYEQVLPALTVPWVDEGTGPPSEGFWSERVLGENRWLINPLKGYFPA
jgi:hypothetical protein